MVMVRTPPTAERVRELLAYDPVTGLFRRRFMAGGRKAGSIAGRHDKDGYIRIKIDEIAYSGHRLAWLYMTGEWPRDDIDHKNLIKDDNSFDNLRPSDATLNNANKGLTRNNKHGLKGVTLLKKSGLWKASITAHRITHVLGFFEDKYDAAKAYDRRAREIYGPFALTNEALGLIPANDTLFTGNERDANHG